MWGSRRPWSVAGRPAALRGRVASRSSPPVPRRAARAVPVVSPPRCRSAGWCGRFEPGVPPAPCPPGSPGLRLHRVALVYSSSPSASLPAPLRRHRFGARGDVWRWWWGGSRSGRWGKAGPRCPGPRGRASSGVPWPLPRRPSTSGFARRTVLRRAASFPRSASLSLSSGRRPPPLPAVGFFRHSLPGETTDGDARLSRRVSVSSPPPSETRPQIRRGDPLNLSILVSGGKETNKDSLSNGE